MYLMYIDIFSEKSIYACRLVHCDVIPLIFPPFFHIRGSWGKAPTDRGVSATRLKN